MPSLPDPCGDEKIRADGQSRGERDDQRDDLRVRPHRRERIGIAEGADDGGVRRVEQLLKDAAQRDGQGEAQQLRRQRAVEHIHFRRLALHIRPSQFHLAIV